MWYWNYHTGRNEDYSTIFQKPQERGAGLMEEKTNPKQWKDLEEYFATEVIEQSKRTAKRWFAIWLITFIALVTTNTVWIYVFNSYEYVQQDGNGVNNYHTDIDGDLENGTKN